MSTRKILRENVQVENELKQIYKFFDEKSLMMIFLDGDDGVSSYIDQIDKFKKIYNLLSSGQIKITDSILKMCKEISSIVGWYGSADEIIEFFVSLKEYGYIESDDDFEDDDYEDEGFTWTAKQHDMELIEKITSVAEESGPQFDKFYKIFDNFNNKTNDLVPTSIKKEPSVAVPSSQRPPNSVISPQSKSEKPAKPEKSTPFDTPYTPKSSTSSSFDPNGNWNKNARDVRKSDSDVQKSDGISRRGFLGGLLGAGAIAGGIKLAGNNQDDKIADKKIQNKNQNYTDIKTDKPVDRRSNFEKERDKNMAIVRRMKTIKDQPDAEFAQDPVERERKERERQAAADRELNARAEARRLEQARARNSNVSNDRQSNSNYQSPTQTMTTTASRLRNPWQGKDSAKAAAWQNLTQADQEWLGNADPTDPYILRRAPNEGR